MRFARSIRRSLGQRAGAATRFHSGVLLLQPREGDTHDAEHSRTVGRPVPVGATAGHEPEEVYERGEPVRVFPSMAGVSNLHAIESDGDEPFDRLSTTFRARVREDRQATTGMNERNGISHGQPVLGDVRRSARTEVSIEGIARVACPTSVDEHAGEVRATDRGIPARASTSSKVIGTPSALSFATIWTARARRRLRNSRSDSSIVLGR